MIASSRARPLGLILSLVGMAAASAVHAADTKESWRYDLGTAGGDGTHPAMDNLVLASDGNYYGTTSSGGANNLGTVFRITPTGDYKTIHSFIGGAEGCTPTGGLALNQTGALVGIASGCGSGGGTIFRSSLNGTVVVLHTFITATEGYNNTNCSGRAPILRTSDNFLVGTNCYGGPFNSGTVWQLAPNGRLDLLHAFGSAWADGINGRDVALAADETIYGITNTGGIGGNGTIYKITTTGTYSQLYHFTSQGHDGISPQGISIGPDGGIYGVTYNGGWLNQGVVFQFLNGKYKTLHHMNNNITAVHEGTTPFSRPVIDANGAVWGSNYYGGDAGNGAVFKVTKAGVYSTMYMFGSTDGAHPDGAFVVGGGSLFASTRDGGSHGLGALTKLSIGTATTATITATPSHVNPGDSITVKWKSTNANTCTASGNAPGWSGAQAKSGTSVVTAGNYGIYYFWIGCTSTSGAGHSSQLAEVTVEP